MKLDNTDHKIILEALYQLAILDHTDISDDDVSVLDDQELEQRLLKLRNVFSKLEHKSKYDI